VKNNEAIKNATRSDIDDLKSFKINITYDLYLEITKDYNFHNCDFEIDDDDDYFISLLKKENIILKNKISDDQYYEMCDLCNNAILYITDDVLKSKYPNIISFPQPPEELIK
jgi:hypothetical protein